MTPCASADNAANDRTVRVSEHGTGAYTVTITAGKHAWLGDEPVTVGGDDLGLDPYQMLTAALGACTAMTLRMYANHKQWALRKVSVNLTHAKVHAQDCAECETKAGQLDRVEWTLQFSGTLTGTQRARLLEIAQMCPVHRTLRSEIRIPAPAVVEDESGNN